MKQLFPSEIIHNSAENYFNQQHTTSRTIYFILIFILIISLLILPIISIDITSQSNGIIRSTYDDNIIQSAVYGEVIKANVSDNTTVKQGDTLLVISTHKTDEQINYYNHEVQEDSIQMKDLAALLRFHYPRLFSAMLRQEFSGFHGKLEEQNIKKTQAEKEYETEVLRLATK